MREPTVVTVVPDMRSIDFAEQMQTWRLRAVAAIEIAMMDCCSPPLT